MELNAYEFFKHGLQEKNFVILFVNGKPSDVQKNLLENMRKILKKNKNYSYVLKWMDKLVYDKLILFLILILENLKSL